MGLFSDTHVRKYSKDFSCELFHSSSKLNSVRFNAGGQVKLPSELKVSLGESSIVSLFRIVKNPFVPIIKNSVMLGVAYELIIEAVIPLLYFKNMCPVSKDVPFSETNCGK
tara:strand:- start:91 stop:423 length:333 start_codon:yes stop_codon:yes gene_type:complete